MDTNIWSSYYAGAKAEYAIGSPTLELFCESYKQAHPDLYMEYKMVSAIGYAVKANTDTEYIGYRYKVVQDDFNGIYNHGDGSAMWLAAPSYLGNGRVLFQYQGGITYDGNCRFKTYCMFKKRDRSNKK